jgi:hypothetical protein
VRAGGAHRDRCDTRRRRHSSPPSVRKAGRRPTARGCISAAALASEIQSTGLVDGPVDRIEELPGASYWADAPGAPPAESVRAPPAVKDLPNARRSGEGYLWIDWRPAGRRCSGAPGRVGPGDLIARAGRLARIDGRQVLRLSHSPPRKPCMLGSPPIWRPEVFRCGQTSRRGRKMPTYLETFQATVAPADCDHLGHIERPALFCGGASRWRCRRVGIYTPRARREISHLPPSAAKRCDKCSGHEHGVQVRSSRLREEADESNPRRYQERGYQGVLIGGLSYFRIRANCDGPDRRTT